MPHAEVMYEDGSHSIVSYDDESELREMLAENHRRATNGEPSAAQDYQVRNDLDDNDPVFGGRGPDGHATLASSRPAFRAKKVLLLGDHPADIVPVGNEGVMPISVESAKSLIDGMAGDGSTINMYQLIQALRDEASPVHTVAQGKFESVYKATPEGELDLSFLDRPAEPEVGA